MIHSPKHLNFFPLGGSIMTEGFSLNLAKGQGGFFSTSRPTKDGLRAFDTFLGFDKKDRKFEFLLGTTTEQPMTTVPFALEDVVGLKVSAPSQTEQVLDKVIFGYNGQEDTSLTFEVGKSETYHVELSGDAIGMLGYPDSRVLVPLTFDVENCDYLNECVECDPCAGVPCQPIVLNAIKNFKNFPLRGGNVAGNYVNVSPILSCKETPSTTNKVFYCLERCDTGDATALAEVQMQYPNDTVKVIDRVGAITKYQLLRDEDEGAPEDLETSLPSIIKGCEDCPEGYAEAQGGLVYAVVLEDNGEDETSTVEGLPNVVSGTVIRSDGQDYGVGYYTVILSEHLSDEDLAAFTATDGVERTATVSFIADVADMCENETVVTTSWEECGTCRVSEETYEITLFDDECGENKLEALQNFYPDLTITVKEEDVAPCQTSYETTVPTNMVCDECDPIFEDIFTSEAPIPFDGNQWVKVEEDVTPPAEDDDCYCGIQFEGVPYEVKGDECIIGDIGFSESSVQVRVSKSPLSEIREGIGNVDDVVRNVQYVNYASNRTFLGGNLRHLEEESYYFFTGDYMSKNNVKKLFKGNYSNIEYNSLYVRYTLYIKRGKYAQGFGQVHTDNLAYSIWAPVGKHQALENVLNAIATAAGVKPVQAFA